MSVSRLIYLNDQSSICPRLMQVNFVCIKLSSMDIYLANFINLT